jgi:adenylate kinase
VKCDIQRRMTEYDAIFLLGPQGSGKGTQEKLLAEKLGFHTWDTGKVLREHRNAKTVSGETVGELIDRGQLLTDDQLLGVVAPIIAAIPADRRVIFDGIPRRPGQARFLLDLLRSEGRTRLATLVIEVPYEESLRRLLLRSAQEGRADDTRQAIEYRLRQYRSETVPMLPLLAAGSALFTVDGLGSVEEVAARIARALGVEGAGRCGQSGSAAQA